MILGEKESWVALERQRDLFREAERERLAQSVQGPQPGPCRPPGIRGWAGTHLIEWGWRLQGHRAAPEYCCPPAGGRSTAQMRCG